MARSKNLAVKASGLVTAVGFNSAATCAAIRGQISGAREDNLWDRGTGEYLYACRVRLPQWWASDDMLPGLLAPAIHECRVAAQPHPSEHIPLLIGVAAPGHGPRSDYLDTDLLGDVQHNLDTTFHHTSRVIADGRVSLVSALKEAVSLIEVHRVPCCIIAGVDSYMRNPRIRHLLEHRRILTENNSNGFIPGEAGTAILVAPAGNGGDELEILGLSMANEPAHIYSNQPLQGIGLTKACKTALAAAGVAMVDMDYRISDLSGEHYGFKDATFLQARLDRAPAGRTVDPSWYMDLWHPSEYVGEIGAAFGPLALALALEANRKGYAPSPMTLCHFSNDDGRRGAVVANYQAGKSRGY